METGQEAALKNLEIDYVEICGMGALVKTESLSNVFGFRQIAYAGVQQKRLLVMSRVAEQGAVRFIMSEALRPDSPVNARIKKYGDGTVWDIALRVPDAQAAYETAVGRGAIAVMAPEKKEDARGSMVVAAVRGCGDIVHTLIERHDYRGVFAPGFVDLTIPHEPAVGLSEIDHIEIDVDRGQMEPWADYYEKVLGFERIDGFAEIRIPSVDPAPNSIAIRSAGGTVTFVINEPMKGALPPFSAFWRPKRNPVVSRIVFRAENLVETLRILQERGMAFLRGIDTSYARTTGPVFGEEGISFGIIQRS